MPWSSSVVMRASVLTQMVRVLSAKDSSTRSVSNSRWPFIVRVTPMIPLATHPPSSPDFGPKFDRL